MKFIEFVVGAAVAGGVAAGAMGFATSAAAQPVPPDDPGYPVPTYAENEPSVWAPEEQAPPGADVGTPPDWAPPKPAEPSWANGNPQVWEQNWQHWGVWMNGVFIPTY